STCRPPRTVRSRWPPRMRPNDMALSNVLAPGRAMTGRPAASVSVGWAIPSSGTDPVPIRPFSDWKNTCMPAGRKFATCVGMPMPRFTSMPGEISLVIRRAMIVCGSMSISCVGDEVIDDRCRRYHMIRRHHADRNDVVGTDDDGLGGHRDHWIEIAGGERIAQIAQIVGDER